MVRVGVPAAITSQFGVGAAKFVDAANRVGVPQHASCCTDLAKDPPSDTTLMPNPLPHAGRVNRALREGGARVPVPPRGPH